MAELFSFPTMLDVLDSLKTFNREKFVTDKQIFKTVKKGVPDSKDQYPILTLEPIREEVELIGSGEQFYNSAKN